MGLKFLNNSETFPRILLDYCSEMNELFKNNLGRNP